MFDVMSRFQVLLSNSTYCGFAVPLRCGGNGGDGVAGVADGGRDRGILDRHRRRRPAPGPGGRCCTRRRRHGRGVSEDAAALGA